MFGFRKKPTDQQKVDRLTARSEAALSTFVGAISTLRKVVEDIDHTVSYNRLTIGHLENLNAELQQAADKNTNIINNFTRLIEGDTEN